MNVSPQFPAFSRPIVTRWRLIRGDQKMPDYRAYILGAEGHRFRRVAEFSMDHADDVTAFFAAKNLIDGHDVECWDGGRLVARLDRRDGNPTGDVLWLTEAPALYLAQVLPDHGSQLLGALGLP